MGDRRFRCRNSQFGGGTAGVCNRVGQRPWRTSRFKDWCISVFCRVAWLHFDSMLPLGREGPAPAGLLQRHFEDQPCAVGRLIAMLLGSCSCTGVGAARVCSALLQGPVFRGNRAHAGVHPMEHADKCNVRAGVASSSRRRSSSPACAASNRLSKPSMTCTRAHATEWCCLAS